MEKAQHNKKRDLPFKCEKTRNTLFRYRHFGVWKVVEKRVGLWAKMWKSHIGMILGVEKFWSKKYTIPIFDGKYPQKTAKNKGRFRKMNEIMSLSLKRFFRYVEFSTTGR